MNSFKDKREFSQQWIVILTLVTLIGSGYLVLKFVHYSAEILSLQSNSGTPWAKDRVNRMISFFEGPLDKSLKILFIGASDIQSGIYPALLNQKLEQNNFTAQTFNLGVANFDGKLAWLLARRLREIFNSKKISNLAFVIKFTPLRATERYQENVKDHYFRHFEDLVSEIYSDKMLLEDWRKVPAEISEIWYVKKILAGNSPISYASYINEMIWRLLPSNHNTVDVVTRTYNLQKLAWGQGAFNKIPAWSSQLGGFHYFGYPEKKDEITKNFLMFQDIGILREVYKTHYQSSDMYNLKFSPEAINDYVNAIKELQKLTTNVILLYFPESDLIPRSPQALGRLSAALKQIKEQTNVKFLDLTDKKIFTPTDYFDQIHLNLKGQAKLATELGKQLPTFLR